MYVCVYESLYNKNFVFYFNVPKKKLKDKSNINFFQYTKLCVFLLTKKCVFRDTYRYIYIYNLKPTRVRIICLNKRKKLLATITRI